jgi:hypothetical protein
LPEDISVFTNSQKLRGVYIESHSTVVAILCRAVTEVSSSSVSGPLAPPSWGSA